MIYYPTPGTAREHDLNVRLTRYFRRAARERPHLFLRYLLHYGHLPKSDADIWNALNNDTVTNVAQELNRNSNTPWTIVAMHAFYRNTFTFNAAPLTLYAFEREEIPNG